MTLSAIKSILSGVGGTFVLAAFCLTFITIEKVLFILPLFIAFNGAMTGFRVVEIMRNRIESPGLFSFVLGAGGGAATFIIVNMAGRFMESPFQLGLTDMAIYIIFSAVTSYLGARLAYRYFNL